MSQRPVITKRIRAALTHVMDTSKLEAEQAELVVTIEGLQALMAKEIDTNSHALQNQDDYRQRFAELETQFEQATTRFEQISEHIDDTQGRHAAILNYLDTLDSIEGEDALKFSPRLWHILIDRATICATGDIAFIFKDGTTIPTPEQTA